MDWLSGLIGGLWNGFTSFFTTSMTNDANRQIAYNTNKTNLQLAREQNDFNARMWQINNEYNSPLQQARRLRQAGISDQAALASVGGFESQPIQSADLANQQIGNPMIPPQLNMDGTNIIAMARQAAALKHDELENKNLENQLDFQVPRLASENEIKAWAAKEAMRLYFYNVDTQGESAQSLRYKVQGQQIENRVKALEEKLTQLGIQQREEDIKLLKQRFEFLSKMNDAEYQNKLQELKNLQATFDEIKSRTSLNQKQGAYVDANKALVEGQTEGVNIETFRNKLKSVLDMFGNPEDSTNKIAALLQAGVITIDDVYGAIEQARKIAREGNVQVSGNEQVDYVLQILGGIGDTLSKFGSLVPHVGFVHKF